MYLDGNIRHRTAAKHGDGNNNSNNNTNPDKPIESHEVKVVRRQHTKLHCGVWSRMVLIVGLFTIIAIMVKEMQQQASITIRQPQQHNNPPPSKANDAPQTTTMSNKDDPKQINHDKCAFRSYPSNRMYGLSSKTQPNFLSSAAYIRGQWPIIINPNENDNKILSNHGQSYIQQTSPMKVCHDTSSWEHLVDKDGKERLPFTDGHNPSVVSLAPNPYISKSNDDVEDSNSPQHIRLDHEHLGPLKSAFPLQSLDSLYLGVAIFGGGQCKFGFTKEQIDEYNFSLYDEPLGGKRAVISVLDLNNMLGQTTLLLEKDAKYGKNRRAIQPEKSASGDGFARIHQEFDDPRLFFHLGRVWVLYRNGPLFGYTDQVHNPIHFEQVSPGDDATSAGGSKFVAYVKASETVWIGGGRNIALISEEPISKENGEVEWVPNPRLMALTWIDPVTVKDDIDLRGVDTTLNSQQQRRLEEIPPLLPQHRRLGTKPNKSNIHGTNGYMVPLTSTGELLGIAHFHRPENRKESQFALHGHHYTHAFFTIARQADDDNTKDISSIPFKLKRLSNEFVFRANSIPAGETHPPIDGDVIQFASGLDVTGGDVDGKLIISYGINDCEGAYFTMAMQKVQEMLIAVRPGQEVVDLMETR